MSKQSRAKSRARRKHRGTGSVATMTFAQSISMMPEAERFDLKSTLMDQLHKILCDHRVFKDNKFLSLFYSNLWIDLEREVAMKNSTSPKRLIALDLIFKIRAFYGNN